MAAKSQEVISWSVFQWVVTGLLACVVALIVLVYSHLISDVGSVRQTTEGIARELTQTREDLVGAIASLREQAAVTNTKLDSVIEELQRPKGQQH